MLDGEHALPQRGDDPVAYGGVPLRPRRVGGDDLDRRRHSGAQLDSSGVDVLLGGRLERVPEWMGAHALTVVAPGQWASLRPITHPIRPTSSSTFTAVTDSAPVAIP